MVFFKKHIFFRVAPYQMHIITFRQPVKSLLCALCVRKEKLLRIKERKRDGGN